jgi:intracellular septation protein
MKKFLFDLFPVLLFFIAYKFGSSNPETAQSVLSAIGLHAVPGGKPGIFLATLVAIVATFVQVAWVKLRGHKVEIMLWVSLVIIVFFGGATLYLQDESFIKWKPTVLYWVFAAAILGASFFGKNLIRSLMGGQMELPDQAWRQMNLSWGGFFAVMGLVNLWVAFNFSTDAWVNFKLYGFTGLMLVFVVAQSLMLTKYMDNETK